MLDVMEKDLESSSHSQTSTLTLAPDCEVCKNEHSSDPSLLVEANEPPDGGLRAWLVVLGGLCNFFATFGLINSWGAFQTYYGHVHLRDVPESDIAWIGSIQYALMFLPGLAAGRLFDLGYFKIVQFSASLVLVAAVLLIGECRTYWQLVLCQGVAIGLSCGCIFGPTLSCVSQWFSKRRATALGLVAVGSSVGGTLQPLVFRTLIMRTSFAWTVRIMAGIIFGALIVSNLTLRRRLAPVSTSGGLVELQAFRSLPFAVYAVSGFVTFLGSSTLLSYLPASAADAGMSADFALSLLSIANASAIIGRVGSGLLADRVGAMNVAIPFTASAGILTYAWPHAKHQPWFVVIAVLFGISSGAYVSLSVVPIVGMGELHSVGRRIGTFQTVTALGALGGIPISGHIRDATHGFEFVGVYAGTMILLSVALMCVTRSLVLGRFLGKI